MQRLFLTALIAAFLGGCASGDPSAPTKVYEPRSMRTGSNIDPRSGGDAATEEDRQRARDEGQALRDHQNRNNLPRREGMPRGS